MEYIERGSLQNKLYDLSIDIDYERMVSFAMDSISKRYVFSLHFGTDFNTPRSESDNLLLSKTGLSK